ncbi:MAG TPA: sigma factor-like helix-turn-helix DNA-binding protein [Terriglobales bacterium]|nr:sigma factor-like helix-turn-helix DNA-binding protein [Terriglobales bacterium]
MRVINEETGLGRCASAIKVQAASRVLNGVFMSAEDGTKLEVFSVWKQDVFAFCRMFLGNGPAAEEAACQAFVTFYRGRGTSPVDDGIRSSLIRSAFQASERVAMGKLSTDSGTSPLERAMQELPQIERAIVIMRNILHMDWKQMASATELSSEGVHEAWKHGFVRLNALLHTDSSKERY